MNFLEVTETPDTATAETIGTATPETPDTATPVFAEGGVILSAETVATRKVHLLYESCCGCGCADETIIRTVAADSPLKDGDRITKLLPGDEYVE